MFHTSYLLTAILILGFPASLRAQANSNPKVANPKVSLRENASILLGKGMHHFFAGEYREVVQTLDASIGLNQRDPRAYFFRGLARLQLDQDRAATRDFRQGAFWEAYQPRSYSKLVSRSLERIQGGTRQKIERLRLEQRHELSFKKEIAFPVRPVDYGAVKDGLNVKNWIRKHEQQNHPNPPQPDSD